mgnify:CR=1 FL=1
MIGGTIYQVVFFDAFNTLFSLRWPGVPRPTRLPRQQTVKQFLHHLDADLQAAYGRAHAGQPGEASLTTRLFAALADWTGLARTGPLALLRRNEGTVRHWLSVYSDTLSTLQVLSEICKLGIISNAWPYLESLLRLLGLWDYFESVIISAQVGLCKPNPAIYELALQTLRLSAEQAIFVDDLPANVVVADRLGFKALWLVRTRTKGEDIPEAYRSLPQIYSLEQVIPLVLGV